MVMDPRCTRCNQPLAICGSWTVGEGGSIIETSSTPKCYETQLTAQAAEIKELRELVARMGRAAQTVITAKYSACMMGPMAFLPAYREAKEIIDLPKVKKIMEVEDA